jgi:hypothetical protein
MGRQSVHRSGVGDPADALPGDSRDFQEIGVVVNKNQAVGLSSRGCQQIDGPR